MRGRFVIGLLQEELVGAGEEPGGAALRDGVGEPQLGDGVGVDGEGLLQQLLELGAVLGPDGDGLGEGDVRGGPLSRRRGRRRARGACGRARRSRRRRAGRPPSNAMKKSWIAPCPNPSSRARARRSSASTSPWSAVRSAFSFEREIAAPQAAPVQ